MTGVELLSEAERAQIVEAYDHEADAHCWQDHCEDGLWHVVAQIVAARLAAAEAQFRQRTAWSEWRARAEAAEARVEPVEKMARDANRAAIEYLNRAEAAEDEVARLTADLDEWRFDHSIVEHWQERAAKFEALVEAGLGLADGWRAQREAYPVLVDYRASIAEVTVRLCEQELRAALGWCEVSAPKVQGLDLFEHYEANGALLVVTSEASALRLEPGDFIVRRVWSTAAEPIEFNRAGGAS